MARRKRSPTSIRWNHGALSQQVSDTDKCLVCTSQVLNGSDSKTPVEKEDYFIDSDGTLTIKNGICPRTLALNLLMELSQNPARFESDLGKHLNIFVLNLEQILKSHNQKCPGETASQIINAENFITAHKASQKLLSQARKRHHDEIVNPLDVTPTRAPLSGIPDNFLAISEEHLPTMVSSSFNELQSSLDCDDNNNDSNMGKSIISEGNFSDIPPSPIMRSQNASPSLSSTPVGMTVAEAAIANKQMTNTKRGSKILPVASSSDGQTKYNCPICNLELSGDHELTVHIRSHNQTGQQAAPNSCTICGKTLSSQSSLDRHMLVHSGERPFKCKICDMSFTTNGNMHRHSRIHLKNGINIKTPGRKSAESKLASEKSPSSLSSPSPSLSSVSGSQAQLSALMAGFRDSDKLAHRKPQQDQNVDLLQYWSELNKLQQLKMLDMTRSYLYPYPAPHHSAFPYSPLVADPLTYMQAMIDPTSGEPMNKRICLPHRVLPQPREPSPDLRAAKSFDCPECNTSFKSQFSLESHMETHVIVDKKLEAEGGAACKTCKTIAKSEESLLLHNLTHHKEVEDLTAPDSNSSPPLSPSNIQASATLKNSGGSKKIDKGEERDAPASFMDLGFANFTTKKFPLIAKAFCEDNSDLKTNSTNPVYKCQECNKEFPVEGAKDLHEASHVPEEYTRCPKCNCHFSDSSRLQEHMLKHVSDLKFEKSLEEDGSPSMPQNYFLAQFGLITAEDHGVSLNSDNMDQDDDEYDVDMNLSDAESLDVSLQNTAESVGSDDVRSLAADSDSQILTLAVKTEDVLKDQQDKSSLPDLETLQGTKPSESKKLPISTSLFSPSSRSYDRVLPPSFQCKHCNMVLSSAKAFKQHQSMHKEGLPFQCKVCSYSSTDKSTLLRHMRTHSGERPYKCKLCDYSFTTKANCERHLRQKHNLPGKDVVKEKLIHTKFDLQDIIQTTRKAAKDNGSHAVCESCGIDFQHYHSLQQHLHNSPDCRMVFSCKSCKMTFPTKQGISQHMSKKHADVPSHLIGQLVSSVENIPDASLAYPEASTPPPAHSVTKPEVKVTLEDIDKATSSRLLKSYLMNKSNFNFPLQLSAPDIVEANKPLDFSTKTFCDRKELLDGAMTGDPTVASKQEVVPCEDEPMDLSVSRRPTSSNPAKLEDNQTNVAMRVQSIKEEPKSPTKFESGNNSDSNNNQLSSLFISPLESSSLAVALSRSPRPGTNPDNIPVVIPSSHLPKHPAFPQFLPVILPPNSARVQLMTKPTADISTNLSTSGLKSTLGTPAAHSPLRAGRSLLSVSGRQFQGMQPSVVLEDLKKEGKKSEKGSSSGSESSYELASVNKMLDATDAQNFQDYLMIPETEDEQGSKSDSFESEEDSNMSMENMFSNSRSFNDRLLQKISEKSEELAHSKKSPEDSKKGDDDLERTVTVGMALLEGGIPTTIFKDSALSDSIDEEKIDIPDPSNMSEQAIAKLIEKVSRENAGYPIKKKRNSYADSPHKFSCPYCPRCFPWLSSLNRHLLTHTGQKPFKCPRCPVTFSTKSNRERHLIRKHNVNMLDPASRSTMDRPYKCHLCVFSSFATQSNLIKHYKERHDGASPPLKALEAVDILDKSFSDTEMDEGNGKTCEEEEEEYAMAQIQNNGLSDQELMLQNYTEEEESQDETGLCNLTRDPHKKRNAIFDFLPDTEAGYRVRTALKSTLKEQLALSNGLNGKIQSSSPKSLSNILTLPGIDETVLTDNMKAFLGKSIQQSLEDSQRKALEEGSTFSITPAVERHLRRLPKPGNSPPNQGIQCVKCDEQFSTKKQLLSHFKTHILEMPFPCYLCDMTFATRVECLQHQAQAHSDDWQAIQEKNTIGNLAVFATRLDKGIVKICKKGKDIMERQAKSKSLQEEALKIKEVLSTAGDGKEHPADEAEKAEGKIEPEVEDKPSATADVLELKDNSIPREDNNNVTNNFLNEVLSTDYLQRKVHCAVCPKRFWSQQDLKRHMKTHTDKKAKEANQTRLSEDVKHLNHSVPTANGETPKNDEKSKGQDDEKCDADMLHDLLGVESTTIDQIFESRDSAASLLGFDKNSHS